MTHSGSNSSSYRPVVALVGPTATGKTGLAIEIAQWLGSEIISADSQVIYRELNIGTAKPTLSEQQGIPHHMIDVAEPTEVFSASSYQLQASAHLESLWKQGKIPIVTGGTGFYIRALLEADFIPPAAPNEAFRQQMAQLVQEKGGGVLYERLLEKDPERAGALHPNDHVRLIRALEIIEATGKPVPKRSVNKNFSVVWLGLTYEDRDLLRGRIDQRIELMMQQGWLEEVHSLVQRYGPEANALKVAHGYPELADVVLGKRPLAEAMTQIQINIHQYARRQMTWFKRNPDILWLLRDRLGDGELRSMAEQRIKEIVRSLG